MTTETLIHIAIVDDWEASRAFGEYEVATRGHHISDVGHIHACAPDGVARVLERVYGDLTLPLLAVVVDPAALRDAGIAVETEQAADGTLVARILGPIPMDGDVVRAEITLNRIGGRWQPPVVAP